MEKYLGSLEEASDHFAWVMLQRHHKLGRKVGVPST